jgi:cytochrome c oxidase assembly protein subunit 15
MAWSGNRAVALWLFIVCALIYAVIVLGGVTRLTHSGLSMVDWDPIMGIVPPVTDEQWQAVFEKYRQFPEYRKINRGMSLSAFKEIFYVEYAHRVLGRLIGLVFLVPLVVFVVLGHITRPMIPRFAGMFILGGLQGVLGWIMVQSGLVDRPSVSQYRLTAHLMLAVFIYAFILWSALSLWRGTAIRGLENRHRLGWWVLGIVLVMIASGGFVAGTRAGFTFNTFPLMAGAWIPEGIWSLSPGWRNLFENVATIQFVHRALALLVALAIIVYWTGSRSIRPGARLSNNLMLFVLVLQVSLGIATLLCQVPVPLAAAHQAGAVALLTLVLVHTHCLKYAPAGTSSNRQSAAGGGPGVTRGVH